MILETKVSKEGGQMKRNTGWAICLSSTVNLPEVSATVLVTDLKHVTEEADASSLSVDVSLLKNR